MKNNFETLWYGGTRKPVVLYGRYWKNKPGMETEMTVQVSGAMLIEAAALLKKHNMF
ncbi:hypothetical protein [Paraflavitalea speifideaquila]|uniref:hypothetical protein n=1 Tax=Paraflavitalea speifideaquila TaxID=3076558 RepID=UPI0028E72B49|nr:hypothetical protein [Paraflavitalea speifideiaquila]